MITDDKKVKDYDFTTSNFIHAIITNSNASVAASVAHQAQNSENN